MLDSFFSLYRIDYGFKTVAAVFQIRKMQMKSHLNSNNYNIQIDVLLQGSYISSVIMKGRIPFGLLAKSK
jgi:hypothetical protein